MAFMIVAVFIFFVLVGLFFLSIQFGDVKDSSRQLETQQAISSIETISNMPELNYKSSWSMALDEDKLKVMSGSIGDDYKKFWPVSSIKIYKIYPAFTTAIKCPATNCNFYEVYNNGQTNIKEYSAFVSICKKINGGSTDDCSVGKLVVGVKLNE